MPDASPRTVSQILCKRFSTACYFIAGAGVAALIGGSFVIRQMSGRDYLSAISLCVAAAVVGVLAEIVLETQLGGWRD